MLDEPLAGINPGLAGEIVRRLRDLREAGMTLLIVEHNLPLVTDLCDSLAVLNGGAVVIRGTPGDVLGDPEIREVFLGD
jgi:ABC-type branched-subunit amino acid transport system ATPase component